jgi:hypothetical protein
MESMQVKKVDKKPPQCYTNCKYLIDTLTKCDVCKWRDPNLAPKKGKK